MCPCPAGIRLRSRKTSTSSAPCDYRDADLDEYGACYCGLYVSKALMDGKIPQKVVPERRPTEFVLNGFLPVTRDVAPGRTVATRSAGLALPGLRLPLCPEQPPEVCPICKVKKESLRAVLSFIESGLDADSQRSAR